MVINTTGGPPLRDATVIVRDGRIAEIGSAKPPQDADILDGSGKFLIPGLWDMHVHLSWTTSSALPVLVANGVTTVRDLGSRFGEIDEWRTKIAAGLMTGPRILRVGPILNGQKFNEYQIVTGNPDETRGVARALTQIGVDFLKVHRRMPRDSYFALIDEGKKLGISVVGHIPLSVAPEEASNAGQATIEHTETLFEGTFATAHKDEKLAYAIRHFREDGEAERLFAVFVKNHTVVDPTLAAWLPIVTGQRGSDPRMRYVAASNKKSIPEIPSEDLQGYRETFAEFRKVVGLMNRTGVTLVTGTDVAGPRIPGFPLHDELALFVESGLTPMQAIQAATITSAKVVGKSNELGSIEVGKIADLVLLDANPLDDIHNTQKIAAVIVGGRLLRRADLDALLRLGEELAAKN